MAEIFIHLNLCSLLKKSSLLTFIKYFCHVYNINISNYIYDENSFWPMIYFFLATDITYIRGQFKTYGKKGFYKSNNFLFLQYALRAENDLST